MSHSIQRLIAGAAFATLFAATAANAGCGPCGSSPNPGLLGYLAESFSAPAGCFHCAGPIYRHGYHGGHYPGGYHHPVHFHGPHYHGDYMVNQGPVYSGPALMAPQPTYAPTPTASHYPYVSERPARYEHEADIVHGDMQGDLPANAGGPKTIRARAVVKIHSPQRMDIHLYR